MVQESQWALAAWRKSRSSTGGNGCVECAVVADAVGVRDSRDPQGPMLAIGRPDWRRFVEAVKDDRL